MNSNAVELRVGSQRPTHLLVPDHDTFDFSEGDLAIELAADLGLHLLDFQCWLVRWILATDSMGRPAANTVVITMPRQSGKGSVLEALEIYWLTVAGVPDVLHTAHEADVAAGHQDRIDALTAEPLIPLPKIKRYRANGKEKHFNVDDKLSLTYRTRTKSVKRGSSPQRIVLDESQELQDSHLAALVPAMAAQSMDADKLPQLIYTGSAPLEHSLYMHRLIDNILDKKPPRTFLAMWAADDDADVLDVENWYATNPALGTLISEEWIRDTEALTLSPEDFGAERLGIRKKPDDMTAQGPIPLATWDELTDIGSTPLPDTVRWALDVAHHDRSWATICLAGRRADGLVHVEVTTAQPGVEWITARAVEIQTKLGGVPLTIGAGTPAESLVPALTLAGVTVDVMKPGDQSLAFTGFVDACLGVAPLVRHRGEPALRRAVKNARTRPWTDGGQTLSRKLSVGDVSPFSAVLQAFGRLDVSAGPKEVAEAHMVFG